MCMKYKYLDSVDFFVLCVFKKLRKWMEYIWTLLAKADCVNKGYSVFIITSPSSNFNVKHFDVWHISADMASNKYNL